MAGIQKNIQLRSLFDSHYRALCAFAYRYVPDVATTEDLVQEVFVAFWENRQELQSELAAKSYLYTSVRNKCLNFLKHQQVVASHQQQLISELQSDQFFLEQVMDEEVFNKLYQEINTLPKGAQEVMLLAMKGLKNKDIAAALGISENTVKTQKKIAYAKLKKRLSPMLQGVLLSF